MKSESVHFSPPAGFRSKENESHAVLDTLLKGAKPQQTEVINLLLDLKFALIQREKPKELLILFFALRRELETTHYLSAYRLRRCLEQSIRVAVSLTRGYPEQVFTLRLSMVNNLHDLENVYRAEAKKDIAFGSRSCLQPRVEFRLDAE